MSLAPPSLLRGQPFSSSDPILFYDGHCALCHGAVLFILARDRNARFRFAPLESATLAEKVPDPEAIAALPDSIVLFEGPDTPLLVESDAVVRLLVLLGGIWRVLGTLLRFVPRPLRNLGYRFVAHYRQRWFGTTESACPIMPPEYRARFDLE